MEALQDPWPRARAAQASLWVYLLAQVILFGASLLTWLIVNGRMPISSANTIDVMNVAGGLLLLISFIAPGMWIYRVAWNAYQMSNGGITTPGWAVGWYFIPFANLIKPFHAMKECWMASHGLWDNFSDPAPDMLRWWWGLWIVTNIIGNISTRLQWSGDLASVAAPMALLDLVTALLSLPLVLVFSRIIAEISGRQDGTSAAAAFA